VESEREGSVSVLFVREESERKERAQGPEPLLSVPPKAVREGKNSSPRMSGLPVCANQELYLAWFLLLEEMQG
jgi:hypothetical protein